jgi:hypothetical protein
MRNLLRTILCFVVVLSVTTSCDKEDAIDIPIQTISQGSLGGDEGISKQNIVITSELEWLQLEEAISRVDQFTKTEIDFSEYHIIAVFDEVRYNGNWNIEVTRIAEYPDRIVVNVKVHHPSGIAAPQIITQPYHIVKIPISSKRIEFNI